MSEQMDEKAKLVAEIEDNHNDDIQTMKREQQTRSEMERAVIDSDTAKLLSDIQDIDKQVELSKQDFKNQGKDELSFLQSDVAKRLQKAKEVFDEKLRQRKGDNEHAQYLVTERTKLAKQLELEEEKCRKREKVIEKEFQSKARTKKLEMEIELKREFDDEMDKNLVQKKQAIRAKIQTLKQDIIT